MIADGRSAADLCGLVGVDRDRLAGIVTALISRGRTVATAESLTAGLLAAVLAEIPGVSATLRGGIVCYATDLKSALVGVDPELLARRGAVDPDVARQLARGARVRCGADIGIGLTGVAGPDPQDGVAAGTVYVAADLGAPSTSTPGGTPPAPLVLTADLAPGDTPVDRWAVRAGAVRAALGLLEELANR